MYNFNSSSKFQTKHFIQYSFFQKNIFSYVFIHVDFLYISREDGLLCVCREKKERDDKEKKEGKEMNIVLGKKKKYINLSLDNQKRTIYCFRFCSV